MLIKVGNYLINPDAIDYVVTTGVSPNEGVTALFRCGEDRTFEMTLPQFQATIQDGIRRQNL